MARSYCDRQGGIGEGAVRELKVPLADLAKKRGSVLLGEDMLLAEGKLSLKEAMISSLDNLLKYLRRSPFPLGM
jgi:hypothetical protein